MLRKGEGKERGEAESLGPPSQHQHNNLLLLPLFSFPKASPPCFAWPNNFSAPTSFLLPLQADACAERHSNQARGHRGDGTTFFTLSHRRGPTGANNLENQRKRYHCSLSGWAKLDPVYFLDLLMFVPLPPSRGSQSGIPFPPPPPAVRGLRYPPFRQNLK